MKPLLLAILLFFFWTSRILAQSPPPPITITVSTPSAATGHIFLSSFTWPQVTGGGHLMIVDNSGSLVFSRYISGTPFDFKAQRHFPDRLSYFSWNDETFYILDENYNIVDSWQAVGYDTDVHDLQLLPNGNALLMIYDHQPYDMTPFGGLITATVIDLVIQELTPARTVAFEWNSRHHYTFTDTIPDSRLLLPTVDYAHGNSVDVTNDGHYIISALTMSEVTKINRQTGAIIWRLSGKNNQFAGDCIFGPQHDARQLPNGNITIFDNGNSGAIECQVDEVNMTANIVWQYRDATVPSHQPMGDAQRLGNGNTMIGWGANRPLALTEVTPAGVKAFELELGNNTVSYRAFRSIWPRQDVWLPILRK